MGLVAEYEVVFRHLPLVAVAAAVPEMTLQVDVGQPNQGGPPTFVVRATGGTVEALDGAFDDAEFVAEWSCIDHGTRRHRYRLIPAAGMDEQLGDHVDDLAELQALHANESVVEEITVTADGWIQQRWFADRDAFADYCDFWRRNADSFSLYRLTDAAADGDDDGLTDRQREALATAYRMGYFDVPRTTTLQDVAAELDISAPSLSERLRRAQRRLVEDASAAERHIKPLTR